MYSHKSDLFFGTASTPLTRLVREKLQEERERLKEKGTFDTDVFSPPQFATKLSETEALEGVERETIVNSVRSNAKQLGFNLTSQVSKTPKSTLVSARQFITHKLSDLKETLVTEKRFDEFTLYSSKFADAILLETDFGMNHQQIMHMVRSVGKTLGFKIASHNEAVQTQQSNLIKKLLTDHKNYLEEKGLFGNYILYPSEFASLLVRIYPEEFKAGRSLRNHVGKYGKQLGFKIATAQEATQRESHREKTSKMIKQKWADDPSYREHVLAGIKEYWKTHRNLSTVGMVNRYTGETIPIPAQQPGILDLILADETALSQKEELEHLQQALEALEEQDPTGYLLILSKFDFAPEREKELLQIGLSDDEKDKYIRDGLAFLKAWLS